NVAWNGVGELAERLPSAVFIFGFEADSIDGAPLLGRVVELIHHLDGQEFVRNGEVKPDEPAGGRAGDEGAKVIGMHLEGEIAPVQSERSQRGIVHGWRRRMPDRMAVNRAKAGRSVDRCLELFG